MKIMKSKLLTALMSLAMVLTMMPMMGTPVYADDPPPPAISLGTEVLNHNVNQAEGMQKVSYGSASEDWYVIGYDGEGNKKVAQKGAATLFHVDVGERTKFNNNQNGDYANAYGWRDSDAEEPQQPSNLRNFIETRYITGYVEGEQSIPARFGEAEQSAIIPKTLEGGAGNIDLDKIKGKTVENAMLWPLSLEEAVLIPDSIRTVGTGGSWWLRSPGLNSIGAAYVAGDGKVYYNGTTVFILYGVRPAFNLNLSSVIFTSAAEGGKSSGDVGAGSLESVGTNSSNEWKLTLESGHDSFTVEDVSTCDGKTVIIEYSGAVAAKGEYISAIITDENDAVKYYGNLIEFADEDSTSGTAKVTIDGKMESTDKLYVFNEQLNGDEKTDYSSTLNEIIIPSPTDHTWNTEWSTDRENHWHECSACGKKKDEVAHTWNTEWSTDEYKHWHECTVCGKKNGETVHTWVDATCTEAKTCEICDTTEGDPLGHKYGEWTNFDINQHQRVCEHDKSHVEKENHKWDAGKVTKKATEKAEGVKTFTCTVCKATKTETIPKLKPSAPKPSGTPLAKATVKNKSMTIGWNKIQGAEGYDIFFALCNHGKKEIKCKKVKTIKGNKTFKWTKSGLKKGTAYKFYVRAYVTKNSKKTYVSKSPMYHAYTANGTKNYTNAKSVTIKNIKKGKLSLKKGKTFKIKAKVNKVNKKKKLMPKSYAPTLRYMTTNKKVATVNSSGKITAKGSGTCTIVAFAHNGVSKSIKVTVP